MRYSAHLSAILLAASAAGGTSACGEADLSSDPTASIPAVQIIPSGTVVTLESPLLQVGGAAASGPLALGRVRGAVIDSRDRLWMADDLASHIVRLQAPAGEVDVIGQRGQGPEEFLQVEILGWSSGRIVAYDIEQRRLALIDETTGAFEAEPLRSAQWDGRPRQMMGVGPRAEYVFVPIDGIAGETGEESGWYQWSLNRVVVEPAEADARTILTGASPVDAYHDGRQFLNHPLATRVVARVHADTVALVGTMGGDVLIATVDGTLSRALNMSAQPGAEIGDDALPRIQAFLAALPPERRRNWVSAELIRDHGLPVRRPFFDRIVISHDGVLWLRRTHDTGDGMRDWDVLTMNGRHLGIGRLEAGEEVLAASSTLVGTLGRDASDAAVVSLYENPFGR